MSRRSPPKKQAPIAAPTDVSLAVGRPKVLLSLHVDHDVLEWFRAQGPDYQGRVSAALRAHMECARSNRD